MNIEYIKERIREAGFTQASLADYMGITESTLNLKINGKAEWWRSEMASMAEAIGGDVKDLFYRD